MSGKTKSPSKSAKPAAPPPPVWKKHADKLIFALLGAIITKAYAIFRPIATDVAHDVISDQVIVRLLLDADTIREGQRVRVTPLLSGATLPTDGGFIIVDCDPDGTKLLEGDGDMAVSVAAATSDQVAPSVYCRALAPGKTRISAKHSLRVSARIVPATVSIAIVDRSALPALGNLSGRWAIVVGAEVGTMDVIHRGSTISGTFSVEGGRTGTLIGVADGGVFQARFVYADAPLGFTVSARLGSGQSSLEISGPADGIRGENGIWTADSMPTRSFSAVAGGPGQTSVTKGARAEN